VIEQNKCLTFLRRQRDTARSIVGSTATFLGGLSGLAQAAGNRALTSSQHPEDSQERQETWRILASALSQGYIAHVHADPDYPEFVTIFNTTLNLAAPNPDFIYLGTPARGEGVYRIRGLTGTNLFTLISTYPGFYAMGTGGAAFDNYFLSDINLGPGGTVDVLLSNERPADYKGNWWKLDPRTRWIGVRVASYDWVHERDPALAIERVDVPAGRPRLSAQELSARLANLAGWVDRGTSPWFKRVAEMHAQKTINKIEVHDWGPMGGADKQVYVEGLYELKDSEALVIESAVPKSCLYWSFLVTDNQFMTVDWMNHQSSINAHQATLDSDGKFRAVVSLRDPGVPNWLDTGGHGEGAIQVRWNNCDSTPAATTRVVDLASLRKFLPAETPVVNASQRDAAMRERRLGAQLRRKW
jgi:hypothetical protein